MSFPDPTPVRIRPATPEEAARLSDIARAAKAWWGYPVHWLAQWERDLTVDAAYVRAHTVCVAEVDGGVAGFYALVKTATCWDLDHFWVHPDRIARGVGRRLFAHAVEIAARSGPTPLRIDADPHAEGFYLRMGATRVGEVPAPVDGLARVLPRLELILP